MTPESLTVTVGWTRPNRAADYSPMSDGYRSGAEQHTETIEVEWSNQPSVPDDEMLRALGVEAGVAEAHRLTRLVETIAEACFYATNAPHLTYPQGLTGQICRALDATGYDGAAGGHYSLSVGDTVTVLEVTLACAPAGWARVSMVDLTV